MKRVSWDGTGKRDLKNEKLAVNKRENSHRHERCREGGKVRGKDKK